MGCPTPREGPWGQPRDLLGIFGSFFFTQPSHVLNVLGVTFPRVLCDFLVTTNEALLYNHMRLRELGV